MMIKDQSENLYIQGTLKKKKDVSCDNEIYTANLKDTGHSIKKTPENLSLPIVSVHNHLLAKQQEINGERRL